MEPWVKKKNVHHFQSNYDNFLSKCVKLMFSFPPLSLELRNLQQHAPDSLDYIQNIWNRLDRPSSSPARVVKMWHTLSTNITTSVATVTHVTLSFHRTWHKYATRVSLTARNTVCTFLPTTSSYCPPSDSLIRWSISTRPFIQEMMTLSWYYPPWRNKTITEYKGADKSLARPGRKQARKHVRDCVQF